MFENNIQGEAERRKGRQVEQKSAERQVDKKMQAKVIEGGERPVIPLRKFNPSEQLKPNSMCVIIAPSEAGKTTLACDLIFWMRDRIPAWFVYSESEGCSGRLAQMFPPSYIMDGIDTDHLEAVYKHQQTKVEKYARPRSEADRRLIPDDELEVEERFYINPCIGLYLEDLSDRKIFNQKIIQTLFKSGRHRQIFSIIPSQFCMDMNPGLRKQIKFVFIFREDSEDVRKKLHKHLGGICGTFDVFNEFMRITETPFTCLVINNISKSQNISDRVFWYKAEIRPAFRVGCARYWRFHELNYAKKEEHDEAEQEAIAKLHAGKQRKRSSSVGAGGGNSGAKHLVVPPSSSGFGGGGDDSYLRTNSMLEFAREGICNLRDLGTGAKKKPNSNFTVAMRR